MGLAIHNNRCPQFYRDRLKKKRFPSNPQNIQRNTNVLENSFRILFIAWMRGVSFTYQMLVIRRILVLAFVMSLLSSENTFAEGWRFWKRKTTIEGKGTAGPVEQQTVGRAEMDRSTVEKQIRDAQKARAKADKKRRDDMAKALKKKEREMLKEQRDVKRKQAKLQREQEKKLKSLSRSYEGKRSWQFWKRPDTSSDFFLPQ